jgi:antitoxin component YwqK of YwqJK toxin-antitoxin module
MKKLSVLFILSLCLFILYGCGSSIKCYNADWSLNKNPDKDSNWEIINCYNVDGKKEGKEVYYYENWQIEQEWNYIDDKKEGTRIKYYENWQIEIEW